MTNTTSRCSGYVDAESAFTPQALIEAVRAEKGMTLVTVPEVCILEFDGDLTDQLQQSNTVEVAVMSRDSRWSLIRPSRCRFLIQRNVATTRLASSTSTCTTAPSMNTG